MTLRLLVAAMLLLHTATAASAAAVQIVAFGDSATAGYLVAHKDSYPAQLQAALRAKGHDVDVHNEGISGDTAAGALRRFDMAISPGTDIAIVEFGVNDLRRGASMGTLQGNIDEIVRTLRARHIQVLVIGLGRLDLSAVARTHGALYEQWQLPPGQHRAADGAHFNAAGYALLVKCMLPAVESLIARVPAH